MTESEEIREKAEETIEMNEEGEEPAQKQERKATKERKVTNVVREFPLNSIEKSLAIPQSIAKNNAGNPWSSSEVAKSVGVAPSNTNFFYLTSSSRDYGFTIGTSRSKTIELTALGRKITFPETEEDEKENIITAFFNVELFKKVFEYYKEGTLPEDKYFSNTLKVTFGVDASLHGDFIQIYKENLEYLNSLGFEKRAQVKAVTTEPQHDNASQKLHVETNASNSNKTIFVVMPFSEKTGNYPKGFFDEVYNSLIVPASAEAGYTAKTAKRTGSDIIHRTIVNDIYSAEIIIADLTEHNPNVLFELGLAIAFKKKVALIRAKGTLPIFDVDNMMRVFDYDGNLWKSTIERDVPNLAKHISSTVGTHGSEYLDILLKP